MCVFRLYVMCINAVCNCLILGEFEEIERKISLTYSIVKGFREISSYTTGSRGYFRIHIFQFCIELLWELGNLFKYLTTNPQLLELFSHLNRIYHLFKPTQIQFQYYYNNNPITTHIPLTNTSRYLFNRNIISEIQVEIESVPV